MKFKSQICTTKEQSERLLALGLKKETADMVHQSIGTTPYKVWYNQEIKDDFYPAWSLHRLLEMLYADIGECTIFFSNTYDEIIADIENYIRRGTFNKDYLEEKV